jgi:N-acyl-D-aspartate/D-glutamate deacylase
MLDLLIRNARICDGTGAPSFVGSLGVEGGVLAPGFVAMPGRILRSYE